MSQVVHPQRTRPGSSLTYALRSRLRYNEVDLDRNRDAGIAVVDEWNVGQNPRMALSIPDTVDTNAVQTNPSKEKRTWSRQSRRSY